ncbi:MULTISPECIES: barstar family protein [unclassified Nitrospina]|uniref:barstar family protein n=1 Tax=unclassified Nitrospina TaxID=2638683 RepID=UPI003F950D19
MELYQSVRYISADSVHFIEEMYLGSLFNDEENLKKEGFLIMEAHLPSIKSDLSENSRDREFLAFVAEVMKFPDYFGKNWDALIDCMSDMAWWPAKGYVLVLHGAQKMWCIYPLLIGNFVECWLFCAERWREREKPVPFHLVFAFD